MNDELKIAPGVDIPTIETILSEMDFMVANVQMCRIDGDEELQAYKDGFSATLANVESCLEAAVEAPTFVNMTLFASEWGRLRVAHAAVISCFSKSTGDQHLRDYIARQGSSIRDLEQGNEELKKAAGDSDHLRKQVETQGDLIKYLKECNDLMAEKINEKEAKHRQELSDVAPPYIAIPVVAKIASTVLTLNWQYIAGELRRRLKSSGKELIVDQHDGRKTQYYPLLDVIECLIELRKDAPDNKAKPDEMEWMGVLSKNCKKREDLVS